MSEIGAICFGLVIGWVTYRTLRRKVDGAALGDIAGVIGAVGGAAITTLYKEKELFAAYSIGLAIGFFAYLIIGWTLDAHAKRSGADMGGGGWMGQ
jgi:uncharacterized membrane protein YeaQ/YmgE (transglycosylase-associated protein family)